MKRIIMLWLMAMMISMIGFSMVYAGAKTKVKVVKKMEEKKTDEGEPVQGPTDPEGVAGFYDFANVKKAIDVEIPFTDTEWTRVILPGEWNQYCLGTSAPVRIVRVDEEILNPDMNTGFMKARDYGIFKIKGVSSKGTLTTVLLDGYTYQEGAVEQGQTEDGAIIYNLATRPGVFGVHSIKLPFMEKISFYRDRWTRIILPKETEVLEVDADTEVILKFPAFEKRYVPGQKLDLPNGVDKTFVKIRGAIRDGILVVDVR